MGKLPSSSAEANLEVVEPIPKCRSTTPPVGKARSRSHTWSQVKGLIIKNVRENRKTGKNLRQTLSYPASPGGSSDTQPNLESNSTSATGSDIYTAQQLSAQDFVSPSLSSSSSSSSSPPLSRPTNLPLNLDTPSSAAPVPPPRVKKKKSLLNFNAPGGGVKKPAKCVDLRSSHVPTGGAFTSMMKKFRKPLSPRACLEKSNTNYSGANAVVIWLGSYFSVEAICGVRSWT